MANSQVMFIYRALGGEGSGGRSRRRGRRRGLTRFHRLPKSISRDDVHTFKPVRAPNIPLPVNGTRNTAAASDSWLLETTKQEMHGLRTSPRARRVAAAGRELLRGVGRRECQRATCAPRPVSCLINSC